MLVLVTVTMLIAVLVIPVLLVALLAPVTIVVCHTVMFNLIENDLLLNDQQQKIAYPLRHGFLR
jgi:hypothetical protein